MKRIGLITLIVALLVTACGGDSKDKGAQNASASDSTTSTTTAEGVGTGQTPGGTQSQGTPGGSNGAGGGTTTTTAARSGSQSATQDPAPDPEVHASLERDCVRKGPNGDTQALIMKSSPGDTVAWSTAYSDGTNELSNPEYKSGGSGFGKTNDVGHYKTSWKVPSTAPLGTATLHTIAKGKFGPKLTFRVVGETEKC